MGKANAKGRTKGGERFVALPEWLLASPAYRSLTPYGRCLLVELKRLYNGTNNGDLFLSQIGAAERIGVAKKTAQKALAELRDRGFIRPAQGGSFNWKNGQATRWILTENEHNGRPATKEFMRWSLPEKGPKRATTYPGSVAPEIQNAGLPRSPHRATTYPTQATTYPGSEADRATKYPAFAQNSPETGLRGSPHLIYQDGGARSDGSRRPERSPRRSEVEGGGGGLVAIADVVAPIVACVPASSSPRVGTKRVLLTGPRRKRP